MRDFLRTLYKPELYHGHHKTNRFFEGWYFKCVSENEREVFSIIPGIFKNQDKSKEHAFIQFLDGKKRKSYYIKYPADAFIASKDSFEVNVGESYFSDKMINLKIDSDELVVNGTLIFKDKNPIPVTTFSPGIMGYYSFVPVMQCNHGVLSMESNFSAEIQYNQRSIKFENGRAYIEKDWGSEFPRAYIWLQCNHFDREGVSLFGSVAHIPWFFTSFKGFIFGFLFEGKIHRFATYTGAKVSKVLINEENVEIVLEDKDYILEIIAYKAEGALLLAPYSDDMISGRVSETLDSKIWVKFIEKNGKNVLYESEGRHAGLEVVGRIDQ